MYFIPNIESLAVLNCLQKKSIFLGLFAGGGATKFNYAPAVFSGYQRKVLINYLRDIR